MRLSGAFGSKGRTSWTGNAEVGDYTSVAGFLIYYLHELGSQRNNLDNKASKDELKEENSCDQQERPLQIVIGGYSYGSMIASKVPSMEYLLYRFSTGADGTAFTEIILRARSLAQQTQEELWTSHTSDERERRDSTRQYGANLHVGGEETYPEHRRRSQESRISNEIHRSIQLVRKLPGLKRTPTDSKITAIERSSTITAKPEPKVKPAYLLISPLLPPISSLTALSFFQASSKTDKEELQERLSTNPSLAVFGSSDIFTSTKKLRSWAQSISAHPNSSFQFVEIDCAGHFWHEDGVEKRLRLAVREWIRGLVMRDLES